MHMQPNPILSFGFIEGNFVIVFMALLIIAMQYHEYHTLKSKNLILWILLPWCITIFGAIFAAVGTHYATPTNQLPLPKKAGRRNLSRIINNAWVINGIAIAFPVFISITVAVPTFIANTYFQRSNHLHDLWVERYSNYSTFSEEMVIEAQLIWFTLLKSTFIASTIFCLWFVWASICFIICTLLSLRLLRTISQELARSNMFAPNFVVSQKRIIMTNQDLPNEQEHHQQQHSISYKAQGRRKLPRGNHSYFLHSTNSFPSLTQPPEDCHHDVRQTEETYAGSHATEGNRSESMIKRDWESNEDESLRSQSTKNNSFFKRMLPNIIMTTEKAQNNAIETMISSRDEQKRELRKAAIHIFTQYSIVGPGCAAFGAIALMMGLVLHGSFEQPSNGGTKFEFFGALALLIVMYAVSFFGWICAGAIFHRTYEPVFVNYSTNVMATTTSSSFAFGNRQKDENTIQHDNLTTMDSARSKLHDFIRVGGGNPKVRNKIRYPQAMVKSMVENTNETTTNENNHNNSLFRFNVSISNDQLRKSEIKYKSIKRKQSSRFDASPLEGELVNNSVVVINNKTGQNAITPQ